MNVQLCLGAVFYLLNLDYSFKKIVFLNTYIFFDKTLKNPLGVSLLCGDPADIRPSGIKGKNYGHLPPHFHLHSMTFGIVSRTYMGIVQIHSPHTLER